MRDRANVVIVGAGIVGASAAYHLRRLGWRDIVVVDQGPLFETGGSTSHAPGLVFQTNSSEMMCRFAQYTVELLSRLEHDGRPSFYPVGGLEVAGTPERWDELHRRHGWATGYGLDARIVSPEEAARLVPLIDPAAIHGGYYIPTDGDARAVRAVAAMAAACGDAAEFTGNTKVSEVEVSRGRARAVITDRGRIAAEHVLIATNIWAPVLGRQAGVSIPLMAVEHQYAITDALPALAGETREIAHPILRHQDASMYFRQHADAYGIGSYQHEPLLVAPEALGKTALKPFTPRHFEAAWASATALLPALAGHELTTAFNGMFAFTPDGMPIVGPAPGIDGLWVAAGVWVTHSGGVGRAIAEWMVEGAPREDVHEADISRFQPHAASRSYVVARSAQQYREVYDIVHPLQQIESPRPLRVGAFYERHRALGGVFFESAGWERPQWFEANRPLLDRYADRIPAREGWAAQNWSPIQGAEHLATREAAALVDLSAFAKIEVSGSGALTFLQRLTANDVDKGIGRVAYTSLLDPNGGIQADLTITRLGETRFLILTGGGGGPRDLAWLRRHAPEDGSVAITEATSATAGLGLWGPRARDVLAEVAEQDVSDAAFPYFTAREISVGSAPALALRVSYAGELGWEIYTPTEYGPRLWDVLWEAGRPHGLIAGGGGAFNSLRLEKGYRLYGAELDNSRNPYQAGLGWAVQPDHGEFIGREALAAIREAGVERVLCCLTLDDPGAVVMGKEPVVDGRRVLGYVTSADYGYSVRAFIAYAYLPVAYSEPGTGVDVVYFGRRLPATVRSEPLFDPRNARLKG